MTEHEKNIVSYYSKVRHFDEVTYQKAVNRIFLSCFYCWLMALAYLMLLNFNNFSWIKLILIAVLDGLSLEWLIRIASEPVINVLKAGFDFIKEQLNKEKLYYSGY
jgi:hypothetical protein